MLLVRERLGETVSAAVIIACPGFHNEEENADAAVQRLVWRQYGLAV